MKEIQLVFGIYVETDTGNGITFHEGVTKATPLHPF